MLMRIVIVLVLPLDVNGVCHLSLVNCRGFFFSPSVLMLAIFVRGKSVRFLCADQTMGYVYLLWLNIAAALVLPCSCARRPVCMADGLLMMGSLAAVVHAMK